MHEEWGRMVQWGRYGAETPHYADPATVRAVRGGAGEQEIE